MHRDNLCAARLLDEIFHAIDHDVGPENALDDIQNARVGGDPA